MAETMVAFQSQLSGVMETVFKAAMFEITRLVEDSFIEEITRCREQMDTLKRRLKVSENQRKQRIAENYIECAKCGERLGHQSPNATTRNAETQIEKDVKLENEMPTDVISPQTTETVKNSPKRSWSPCSQSKKVNREETPSDVPVLPDLDVKSNNSDDELGVPGSSKQLSDPKYQFNWKDHFDQKPEFEPNGAMDISSKTLFQNTYSMENLDELNNSRFEDTKMTTMDNTDDDLIYMGQYEDNVKPPAADKQEQCQIDECKGNSGTWSTSKSSAEFGCLLINEEGHLHNSSNIYSNPSECHPNASDVRNPTGIIPLDNASDILGDSNTISDISHMFEMLQHQSVENGLHACDLCTATFPDSASHKAHMQGHTQPERDFNQRRKTSSRTCSLKSQGPHLCGHCSKAFPSLFRLQKHKCEQTGDKPYSCAVCGNRFSRLWNLKLHQRIHTQEKPHHCTMCDKSFTRADILKVHLRTHTGERPYCCLVCGLSFKRLDHLKSHQRKHMPHQ